jgi:hypothetical protein
MTDQCKHCNLKGDLKACKSSECSIHENWYAVEQQKIIDEQRIAIIDMHASLRTCFNSSQGALDQYDDKGTE